MRGKYQHEAHTNSPPPVQDVKAALESRIRSDNRNTLFRPSERMVSSIETSCFDHRNKTRPPFYGF